MTGTDVSDAERVYTLKTAATDGAPTGDYTVTITAGGVIPMPGTPEAENYDPEAVLPSKYGDGKTSGLKASVSATEENKIDFALSKK